MLPKTLWSCASKNFVQNYVLQALQSKALYGGKTPCKTPCKTPFCKPYKAKLCMAAKLLAEGGKTSFCKPYKAKLCMAFAQEGPQKHVAYKASLKLELRLKKGLQVLFVHCFVSAALPVLTNARFCFFKQEGVSTALASVLTSLFYKKYGPIFTTK